MGGENRASQQESQQELLGQAIISAVVSGLAGFGLSAIVAQQIGRFANISVFSWLGPLGLAAGALLGALAGWRWLRRGF